MNTFLTSNKASWRLARTIVQGVLGAIIANFDLIMGTVIWEPQVRVCLTPIIMAILSPIMAELGKHIESKEEG